MLSKLNQLYLRRLPLFFGIMAMTQFSSCEKDDVEGGQNSLRPQEQKEQPLNYRALFSSHHTIGLDEAKNVALDASVMFDGGDNGLRSGKARSIGDVRVMQSDRKSLRSGSSKALDLPDTLAYLVNFEDNAGYAIVCADDRVGCPLLAYVPEGSLDDAAENPSLSAVLSNMKDCLLNSIEDFEAKKDSMRKVAETQLEDDTVSLRSAGGTVTYYTFNTQMSVPQFVSTQWNQNPSPYYDYLPICSSTNNHMYAGCSVVAAAQVIAYYEYPTNMDGWAFNWSGMKVVPNAVDIRNPLDRNSVGALMYFIGQHANANYTCTGTGASVYTICNWLRSSYGYQTESFAYSFDRIVPYLNLRNPLMMHGFDTRYNPAVGHAWVLDGYVTAAVVCYQAIVNNGNITNLTYLTTVYGNSYLHVNWGWGGSSDGYFYSGLFNPGYVFSDSQTVFVARR